MLILALGVLVCVCYVLQVLEPQQIGHIAVCHLAPWFKDFPPLFPALWTLWASGLDAFYGLF